MSKNLFFLILVPVLFMTNVSGQKNNKKIAISGIVTDAKQNPVPGASIFVDNKQANVITDGEGHYKVKVRSSAIMISVASSVFGVSEAAIDGRTEINFIFSGPALQQAENPVKKDNEESVQVGYGSQKKKDLSTSVGKVDGQNSKYASYSSIYTMIRGEVPGVQVSGRSITIRGRNSINSGGQPLIIVNGITTSSLDNIPPQMVKSIELIKDASASIYGSRGANGVILITLIK